MASFHVSHKTFKKTQVCAGMRLLNTNTTGNDCLLCKDEAAVEFS